jgi:hypothetical protein
MVQRSETRPVVRRPGDRSKVNALCTLRVEGPDLVPRSRFHTRSCTPQITSEDTFLLPRHKDARYNARIPPAVEVNQRNGPVGYVYSRMRVPPLLLTVATKKGLLAGTE